MKNTISDLVVVITGASSGIGRATALRLAREGATLIVSARRGEALASVVEQCQRFGAKALAVPADVTDEEAVKGLARQAIEHFGRIDVWINDAAVSLFARFEDTPPDAFRRVIETNLFGYVYGMRTVLPYFREQGHGTIVNVASVVGRIGQAFSGAYAASEGAILALSESVRMELQDAPAIQVCTVLPATIDTPLFQHAANFSGRAVQAMPPIYQPEQVAEAIRRAIEHPRAEIAVGGAGKLIMTLHKIAPSLAERVYARRIDKKQFQHQAAPTSEGNVFRPLETYASSSGGWREGMPRPMLAGKGAYGRTLIGVGLGMLMAWGLGKRRRHPLSH